MAKKSVAASKPSLRTAASKASKTASAAPLKAVKSPSRAAPLVSGTAYELIVTEKPSTAEKIAAALADGKPIKKAKGGVSFYELSRGGKDVVIASAVGHLFTVAEKEKSFKYPSFDVEWRLTADVEKDAEFSRKYASVIASLARKAAELTVATDYDIEGETIGLNIVRHLCGQQDANRMKFSTVTAEDLREAYAQKARHIDWGQANAGVTRHVLDWYYGINVSRALTQSVKTAGGFMILSSGRVQGPALKIVVDREREIKAFVPVPYWQVLLEGSMDGQAWEALHEKDRFADESDAKRVLAECKGKPATVDRVERKRFNQSPPVPFDLGGLQTESYRAFGISPKETLAIAQSLYTGAFISYPRTSSQKLPAKIGYRKILKALAAHEAFSESAKSLLDKTSLSPNEGDKEDPAHPAIFPTGQLPGSLRPREEKVYDLIVKRFLATFGDDATRETNTVSIVIAGERFVTRGTRTVERGWHALYAPYVDLKEEELPGFKERERVPYERLHALRKETQPPRRYTPSSLVNELEKRGLGTKATRADIIEALARRNYVKGHKSFEATELGLKICEILEKAAPEIVDEALTRHFEEELDQIRSDEKTGDDVLGEAKTELTRLLTKFRKTEERTGNGLLEARRIERDITSSLFPCPVCKEGTLRIMFSKKTKRRFIGCDKYPDCKTIFGMPQFGLVQKSEKPCDACGWLLLSVIRKQKGQSYECINPQCPKLLSQQEEQAKLAKKAGLGNTCATCGQGKLVLKSGRYGMFLSCDRYPECKTIVNIPKNADDAKRHEEQNALAKEAGDGKPCPTCKQGTLTMKRGRFGPFLSCDRYPECKTIVRIQRKTEE